MRFLCEQCKAKYQISDDKVAGKTVRMKCRKCGHLIEVRADVTETSVASSAPSNAPGAQEKPGLPRPGNKQLPSRSKLATSLTSSAPRASANPGALAGAFQRTVSTGPGSTRPAPDDSAALEMLSASANPWYVAINGVPVGPVRLSELRRKAQSGVVTESSLVWQEGVEEWRPIKTFPELAQLVREAAASGRPSLVAPPPAGHEGRISQIPQNPAPNAPQRSSPRPAAARPIAARSNVVPIASRLATAEQLDDVSYDFDDEKTSVDAGLSGPSETGSGARPSLIAPDPFAAPNRVNLGGTLAMPQGPVAHPVIVTPHGAGAVPNPYAPTQHASPVSIAPAMAVASMAPAGVPAPKKSEGFWIMIAFVAMAMAFGVTAAIVLLMRPPAAAAPAPSAVALTTASAPTSTASAVAPGLSAEPVDSAVAIVIPDKVGGPTRSSGAKSSAAGTPTKAVDPGIADLLRGGGNGPVGGAGGGGASGGGGSSLTASEIESVVNNRKVGVTRTCWERNNGNLSSANVTCHVTIAASGAVQSSQADGSDPVVAKCIESQVKTWTFPPSGGSTQVNLPFHFVRQ